MIVNKYGAARAMGAYGYRPLATGPRLPHVITGQKTAGGQFPPPTQQPQGNFWTALTSWVNAAGQVGTGGAAAAGCPPGYTLYQAAPGAPQQCLPVSSMGDLMPATPYAVLRTPRRGPRLGGLRFAGGGSAVFGADDAWTPWSPADIGIDSGGATGPGSTDLQLQTQIAGGGDNTGVADSTSSWWSDSSFWQQAATGTTNLLTSILKGFGVGQQPAQQPQTPAGSGGISPMMLLGIGAIGIGAVYLLTKKK